MNRINPLYVIILLVMVLIFAFVKLSSVKASMKVAQSEYASTLTLANELSGLKEAYTDEKALKKLLRTLHVEKKFTNSSVKLSSKSLNINELNRVMGKLLNGSYNISAMKIKKLSDDAVNFEMEIKW